MFNSLNMPKNYKGHKNRRAYHKKEKGIKKKHYKKKIRVNLCIPGMKGPWPEEVETDFILDYTGYIEGNSLSSTDGQYWFISANCPYCPLQAGATGDTGQVIGWSSANVWGGTGSNTILLDSLSPASASSYGFNGFLYNSATAMTAPYTKAVCINSSMSVQIGVQQVIAAGVTTAGTVTAAMDTYDYGLVPWLDTALGYDLVTDTGTNKVMVLSQKHFPNPTTIHQIGDMPSGRIGTIVAGQTKKVSTRVDCAKFFGVSRSELENSDNYCIYQDISATGTDGNLQYPINHVGYMFKLQPSDGVTQGQKVPFVVRMKYKVVFSKLASQQLAFLG